MRPTFFVFAALLTASVAHAQEPRQRWPDSTPQTSGGEAAPRTAVPRNDPAPQPAPAPAAAPAPAPRATAPARATAADDGDQRTAQPRDRRPPPEERGGVAVPRGSVPPPRVEVYSPPRVYSTYYYPRRYYPYGYGTFGLGYFYYDPYSWYPYDYGSYRFNGYGYGYPTGQLRLKVRPRDAEVYVDGYYAGQVDDFDGMLQALQLEAGPYSIELVAPGHAPLEFDVRIQPGRKITYTGDLRLLQP